MQLTLSKKSPSLRLGLNLWLFGQRHPFREVKRGGLSLTQIMGVISPWVYLLPICKLVPCAQISRQPSALNGSRKSSVSTCPQATQKSPTLGLLPPLWSRATRRGEWRAVWPALA